AGVDAVLAADALAKVDDHDPAVLAVGAVAGPHPRGLVRRGQRRGDGGRRTSGAEHAEKLAAADDLALVVLCHVVALSHGLLVRLLAGLTLAVAIPAAGDQVDGNPADQQPAGSALDDVHGGTVALLEQERLYGGLKLPGAQARLAA